MTQHEIQAALDHLIGLIHDGKTLEAFDKYYHKDFVGQENQSEPRIGKQANREFEENFLANISNVRTYRALNTLVGTNVSAITWEIDIDHNEWGVMKFTEINLQTWEDGQIIRETYNYKV